MSSAPTPPFVGVLWPHALAAGALATALDGILDAFAAVLTSGTMHWNASTEWGGTKRYPLTLATRRRLASGVGRYQYRLVFVDDQGEVPSDRFEDNTGWLC